LNKANKIIEFKNAEIQDLKTQLDSFKNINISQKNNLKNETNNKNDQLNEFKQQISRINLNTNQNDKNDNNEDKDALFANKCVSFITMDSSLFYAIPCSGNSTFAEVEEKLYQEYPEYRETNNSFLANGIEVLRFKTINDNKIGTGKPVILVKPS
jgi:hypothetical protein